MASHEENLDPVHTQCTQQPGSTSNVETILPNPYFLSSNENPGNILVTQPLLGMKNYQSWSRAMVLALTAKKKMGFVNGNISKPYLDSPLYEDWESCIAMVLSWLINSMANTTHHSQILLLCLLVPKAPLCTHCNLLGHTVDKCYKLAL